MDPPPGSGRPDRRLSTAPSSREVRARCEYVGLGRKCSRRSRGSVVHRNRACAALAAPSNRGTVQAVTTIRDTRLATGQLATVVRVLKSATNLPYYHLPRVHAGQ